MHAEKAGDRGVDQEQCQEVSVVPLTEGDGHHDQREHKGAVERVPSGDEPRSTTHLSLMIQYVNHPLGRGNLDRI